MAASASALAVSVLWPECWRVRALTALALLLSCQEHWKWAQGHKMGAPLFTSRGEVEKLELCKV